MRQFVCLPLMIVCLALTATAITTNALAEEAGNPLILLLAGQKFPVAFTSTSIGNATLVTVLAAPIKCTNHSFKGQFESARLGQMTITFTECAFEKEPCNTETAAAGTVEIPADIHVVDLALASLTPGLAITLLSPVTIKCGALGAKVEGTALGQIGGIKSGEFVRSFSVVLLQKGGKQELKQCSLTKEFCNGKKFSLKANLGLGNETAALETLDKLTVEPSEDLIAIDF
jgi:hypothetical protein